MGEGSTTGQTATRGQKGQRSRSGDGKMSGGRELFGDQEGDANGFAKLSKYDTNKDGVISMDEFKAAAKGGKK